MQPELKLKSVLKKLLRREKLSKNIQQYLSSFLIWLLITSLLQSYICQHIHLLWALGGLGAIHFLNQFFVLPRFFPKKSLLDSIEKHLLRDKILNETQRGILNVLGDDLQVPRPPTLAKKISNSQQSSSTQYRRIYQPEMLKLMYQRLERHSEIIHRYTPELPKELMVASLVCLYFFGPQLLQNIDTSLPFDSTRHSHTRDSSYHLKHNANSKPKRPSDDQLAPLAQIKKQQWPKKLSVKLNQKLERSAQPRPKSQQDHQSLSKTYLKAPKTDDDHSKASESEGKYKSKVFIGQIGGRVSAQAEASYSDYGDQPRLIELSPVEQANQQAQKTLLSSTKTSRSKQNQKESETRSLSQSRRQELRNQAYLLGVHSQVQANDFPPALRTLIKSN
ncbi:MAG: hypothetical protein CMH49_09430 [Myxococcales bacterium]|nr:hypothetical protein [Myxococcales bacterium]